MRQVGGADWAQPHQPHDYRATEDPRRHLLLPRRHHLRRLRSDHQVHQLGHRRYPALAVPLVLPGRRPDLRPAEPDPPSVQMRPAPADPLPVQTAVQAASLAHRILDALVLGRLIHEVLDLIVGVDHLLHLRLFSSFRKLLRELLQLAAIVVDLALEVTQ